MNRFRAATVALMTAILGTTAAEGQTTPTGGGAAKATVAWRADYDAALKEASGAKKPLFIAFVMDDEPANDEVFARHFHDPDVVAASEAFVCLLANLSRHPEVERRAREEFMNSPRVAAPQFLFLKPDGRSVVLRHVWTLPPADLVKKMLRAQALVDPARAGDAAAAEARFLEERLRAAASNNAATRAAALAELALLDDPRVVDFFVRQTAESVDEMKRLEAIDAMASRRENGAVLPALHRLLTSSSSRIRTRAAEALEKLAAPESGAALATAFKKEAKDRVRAALLRALAICDGGTPAHRKLIVGAARNAGQAERTAALRALADAPRDDAADDAVRKALTDSSNAVRAAAYFAAGRGADAGFAAAVKSAAAKEKSQDLIALARLAVAGVGGEGFDEEAAGKLLGPYLSSTAER